jgi:hypothetical protein
MISADKNIRDQVRILSIKQSQRFENLDRETKQIVGALLDDIRVNIAEDIQQQTRALAQLINGREIVILDHDHDDQRRVVTLDNPANRAIDDSVSYPIPRNIQLKIEEERAREQYERDNACHGILSSLHFQAETERYESVSEAHTKTFNWIYYKESSAEETKWDDFAEWLEYGDGLYWINGKAGSGKSTLMKYISDNPLTRKLLSTWAGGSNFRTAHFYFWNLGTALQKSQIGLLRSLLLAVLGDNHDLIPLILPQQWAQAYLCNHRSLGQNPALGVCSFRLFLISDFFP